MAEPQQERPALFMTSLESNTSITQPRFSDLSRPSDGTIQVDSLKLTPTGTLQDDEELKDDTMQNNATDPDSPYPVASQINTTTAIDDNVLDTIQNLCIISRSSFTNNTKQNTHSLTAFRKSRQTYTNNSNTKHDRQSSLGTIQSNVGTIGTMDAREYDNMNVRPHITGDKHKKHIHKSPITKLNSDTTNITINEDDANSEIPELPHSTQIKPQPQSNLSNDSKEENTSQMLTPLTPLTPLDRHSTSVQDRQSVNPDRHTRHTQGNKGKNTVMYLDDRDIDIHNIQFDDEVDLTGPVTLTHHLPKVRRIRSTTADSRKSTRSVRFHEASRNTFLSPAQKGGTIEIDEFPLTEPYPQNSSAPMRFKGPARIALLHTYVPMDPFAGDTEIMQWSVGDVKVWISNLEGGVAAYANNFVMNHIKGQDLLRLTDQDLYRNLEVKSVGHRQIIMAAIEELKKCVIVEINADRFLVPPNGAVMRFEDVSVQGRVKDEETGRYELQTILGHVTGTFLPNQITAIMGDTQKSLLLKVLSGCNMRGDHHVSGHIFVNGNPIDGSVVNAGLASYINGDYSYSNFTRTTVSDLVKFYVRLSGEQRANEVNHILSDADFEMLVNHVLRISDINYPQRTKICELRPVQYKRLMIAIDTILYDIRLVFLDKILDGLTQIEMIDMMQMIYSFSRRLDITFILSVERIRYHILNAYFDQVIVVGGVDAQKIINDCTNYYKNADLSVEEIGIDTVNSMTGNDDDNAHYMNYARQAEHQMIDNDLVDSATSVRFVGSPEDLMQYFKLRQVEFVQTENPIEVIFEHVMHNFELIEPELEDDYFRYRKKSNSLSPFTATTGPRNGRLKEIWIVAQFILMVGWREWSLLYSCFRVIVYCIVVGAVFWDVSCEKYFLNERLLAIFVISCIPIAAVYPMLDFYGLHRNFWFNHILFPNRIRTSSFVCALVLLSMTHSVVIGLFSFVPWLMEDLGCNDTIAFIRIGFMQCMTSMIYGVIGLFGAEIFNITGLRIVSLMCTSSVLFAGALVHPGDIANRPGTAFIGIDFLKYSLEFLLFTDVDYIQVDACSDYLDSLKDRQFYDREPVDIMVILAWLTILICLFSFTLKFQLSKKLAYSSQLTIGILSYKRTAEEFEFPALPVSPDMDDGQMSIIQGGSRHYQSQTLSSFGAPTPIHSATNDTAQIPVLPLNITPLSHTSHISNATGGFTRIGGTPLSVGHGTPTTPHHLTEHRRSVDSEARIKTLKLLKQPSIDSVTSLTYNNPPPRIITNINNNNSSALENDNLPYEIPSLAHRRARSGNRIASDRAHSDSVVQGITSIQQNESDASLELNPATSGHQHQISLSGMETIREKKAEELPAVPPTTSDTLLLRQQHIASGNVPNIVHIASVPSHNVKILSTRASMVSQPDAGSRYSAITSFTPLRQQSLVGRRSFSNRRRSSVNMKSQAVPRFLAISPAQSFANTDRVIQNGHFPAHDKLQRGHMSGKESVVSKGTFSNKRSLMASASVNAVNIPFEEYREDEIKEERQRLSTVPSQETATVPRMSEKLVIEDFADKGFEARMKTSPLIFYDLVIVNKYKQLVFNKVSGHAIQNGVSTFLAPSNIDCAPLLRAIAGIYCDELLYIEGKIVVRGRELLTEMKLSQNRIVAYVPKNPVLPDLITVQEIIRLAFILTETGESDRNNHDPTDNVQSILRTMELTQFKDMRVSKLSRMDYLKVAIAYCGLRSRAGIVLVENIYSELNIIQQKQIIRCMHRLSQIHKLSILTTMFELTLESIQQDHINHIILLSNIYNNGVSPIYEGTILESLQTMPKIFTFKKFENVIDELLDISCKTDTQSMQKLFLLVNDLRQSNTNEMLQLQTLPMAMDSAGRKRFMITRKKWLEYWWLGWLYWRFVANHKQIFFIQVFKIFIYVLVVCLAFWNLPSTESGSKSMFGAMNALLFIFIMQTPANHRLFLPLLKLGIQDWQSGKYTLNMMSTLHCWSQYLLSIVLATITSILSYWAVNFNDPATAMGYSIILFTMGYVYSAGVWDSIYFLLFALGCNQNLSFFIMAHLLLYFWLFSGCFILKTSMPLLLRYIGYYANPVRLTLESQYCAIILPKTFGNERGSDILAKSDYDCAIGFDLCLVFLITFILRIVGSFVLSYRHESIPLYNNNVLLSDEIPEEQQEYQTFNDDQVYVVPSDDDDDDDDDGQPANIPLVKSRASKEDQIEQRPNMNLQIPGGNGNKRNSRHKGHASVDHIPTVGSINFTPKSTTPNDSHYINMDAVESKQGSNDKNKTGLIKGLKNFVDNKLKKKNKNEVGLLQHSGIDLDEMNRMDDESDSNELVNLENEYHAYDSNDNNQSRIKYGNDDNNYNTMILGTGADDSDNMFL